MSSVYVLLLSDIHIKSQSDPVCSRATAIASALQAHVPAESNMLALATGDIADSGTEAQYNAATHLFEALADELKQRLKLKQLILHAIPGNHDLDHTVSTSTRQSLIEAPKLDLLAPDLENILLAPQVNFSAFAKRLSQHNAASNPRVECPHYQFYRYQLDSLSVGMYLLNSALASRKHEQPGTLSVAIPAVDTGEPATVSICALHHPLHWLSPATKRQLTTFLTTHVDVVITGHEHTEDSYRIERQASSIAVIEAGALQLSHSDASEFRLLKIDVLEKQVFEYTFKHSSRGKYLATEHGTKYPFVRNASRDASEFQFREEYVVGDLEEIGAPVAHSSKKDLRLSDIFVMPDLREVGSAFAQDSDRVISYRRVLDHIQERRHVLIAGEDRSGKTCLGKVLQRSLLERGIVAVRLSGKDIQSGTFDEMRELISRKVRGQFTTTSPDLFHQRDAAEKAVIIDDFNRIRGGLKRMDEVAGNTQSLVGHVVLITGSNSDVDGAQLTTANAATLYNYARSVILPFGPILREALASRWISLRDPPVTSDTTRSAVRRTLCKTLDEVIGRNLVIPYPFELLAILQADDSSAPLSQVGSLGRAYEAMITISLIRNGVPPNQLNTWFTYLSHLAFTLYSQNSGALTETELGDWHNEHEKRFAISLNKESFLETLKRAGILYWDEWTVCFRYRYVYCFFVAKYLAERITEQNVQAMVQNLLDHIEHEDSSLVLSFLCFSTSDERIRRSLLTVASKYFAEGAEFSFESSAVDFINKCGDHVKLLVSAGESPDDNHKRDLQIRDDASATERAQQAMQHAPAKLERSDAPPGPKMEDFKTAYQAAFKLVGIIGQTLRSHAGSLESEPKLELARAAFSLALRADAARIAFAEQDYAMMQKMITAFVLRNHKTNISEQQAAATARAIIYYFCVSGTTHALVEIATSVTAQELAVTLHSLAKEASTVPYELINLAIRLEHPTSPPVDQIGKIEGRIRKNRYATDVLRSLVGRHLYLFTVRQPVRQSLSSLLNIGSPDIRVGDTRTKRI